MWGFGGFLDLEAGKDGRVSPTTMEMAKKTLHQETDRSILAAACCSLLASGQVKAGDETSRLFGQ